MPLYEYYCSNCKSKFELLVGHQHADDVVCMKCRSEKVRRLSRHSRFPVAVAIIALSMMPCPRWGAAAAERAAAVAINRRGFYPEVRSVLCSTKLTTGVA